MMFQNKLLATALTAFAFIIFISSATAQLTKQPKNIVFIMLDDADYYDFGFNQQQTDIQQDTVTPNIDALRRSGRLYSQFRTASALCSPTRMSVLTGCNPICFGGIDAWASTRSKSGLPNTIPQLGTMMQLAGKTTGFFGKWHVGNARRSFRPKAMGFDIFSRYHQIPGLKTNSWSGAFRFVSESDDQIRDVDFIDRYFADEAIQFIDACEATDENFFLMYTPLTPHYPWAPPRDYLNLPDFELDEDRGKVLSMMHAVDHEIGRVIDRLDAGGLTADTMIVLTSDNGGPRRVQHDAKILAGSKGTLLDGGIRVPLLVSWPGQVPENSLNDSSLVSYDLLPTFAELFGLDPLALEPLIDGRSFVATLTEDARKPHDPIYWELSGGPTRVQHARWGRTQAYQVGDYKLVKLEGRSLNDPRGLRLYNVIDDPSEKVNLSVIPEFRPLVNEMRRNMLAHRKQLANYRNFPEFTYGSEEVPYDPRIDVSERDMALEFDLLVPNELTEQKNLYFKGGVQRLTLTRTGKLRWRINGFSAANQQRSLVLESKEQLEPGRVYRVVLSIGGYKNDLSRIQLFVDGVNHDDSDRHPYGLFSLRSTLAPSVVGDEGVVLDRIKYSTMRLWRSEWDR